MITPVPAYHLTAAGLLIYVDGQIVATIPPRFFLDLVILLARALGKAAKH